MKKYFLYSIVTLAGFFSSQAQSEIKEAIQSYRGNGMSRLAADAEIFQGTIKKGANANQFLIYIRPNVELPVVVPNSRFAGGAPQVSFSVLGTTAVFTPIYELGVSPLSTSTEVSGGRSRMTVGPNNGLPMTLPWAAGEERLAFTVNIAGDDTAGARIENDINAGVYIFYVADEPTASNWTNYTDIIYTGGTGSVEGIDGIYEYATIPSTSVLPVQFAKYDVQCNDKGAIITWATATEQNSNRFEIQRSTDGINWTTIDNVVAVGNSNDQKNYQYLDLNGGTAFYRIRQVDNDGRFVYTAVKRTDCKKTQYDVALYPVPAKDNLSVVIRSDNASRTELQIMDMLGKTLQRVPAQINRGNNNFNLNVSELPAGQYMLVGSDPSIQINKKFTIIR